MVSHFHSFPVSNIVPFSISGPFVVPNFSLFPISQSFLPGFQKLVSPTPTPDQGGYKSVRTVKVLYIGTVQFTGGKVTVQCTGKLHRYSTQVLLIRRFKAGTKVLWRSMYNCTCPVQLCYRVSIPAYDGADSPGGNSDCHLLHPVECRV